MTPNAAAFDVLFVCTGNRFRSPLAARLLSAEVGELPVRVRSVGVLDIGPAPALPEAVALAKDLGIDLGAHRACDLTHFDLEPFDLVLGFEGTHVRTAVVDGFARIEQTFTLPELVGLLEGLPEPASPSDPVDRARARVEQASESRPPDYRTAAVPEVADPLGRPAHQQKATAQEVHALVRRLAQLLFD